MTADDLYALLPELERFHARFGRFFPRSESRSWSRKYLFGLALPIVRKNVENIAEQVEAPPRKLQEALSNSPWDDEDCTDELQGFVGELIGTSNRVLILDDTGLPKGPHRNAFRWGAPEKGDLVGGSGSAVLGDADAGR